MEAWQVVVASFLLLRASPGAASPVAASTLKCCEEGLQNGSDVQLALNCSTHDHRPEVVYMYTGENPAPNFFFLYGTVSIEYTCTNSSDAELVDEILVSSAANPSRTTKLPSTYTDGVQCTFSGCYSIFGLTATTTLALQPTPCTVDINECDLGIDNCTENAECENRVGSFECFCKTGYEGDETHCTNVDECTSGVHNCIDIANCADTEGSYYCECASGYQGDGMTNCTDIDECSAGIHNCSDHAECVNTEGGYNCSCNPGFGGNGYNCTNINECDLGIDNCTENAECENSVGSFECFCKTGYEGNETHCTNVDECTSGVHNCIDIANCADTEGSYYCECASGYQGDGMTNCTDVDECLTDVHGCSEHANCVNTNGSYQCTCNQGFEGNGFDCTSEEMSTFSAMDSLTPHLSDPPATHSHTLLHLMPSPTISNVSIQNLGGCESSDCNSNAVCRGMNETHICICSAGFTGDGYNCTRIKGSAKSWLIGVSTSIALLVVAGAAVGVFILLYARRHNIIMHTMLYPPHFTKFDWDEKVDTSIDLVEPGTILRVPTPTESIHDMLEYSTLTLKLTEMTEAKETTEDNESLSEKMSGRDSADCENLQADISEHQDKGPNDRELIDKGPNASHDGQPMSDSCPEADSHQEQTQPSLRTTDSDVKQMRGTVLSLAFPNFHTRTVLQQLDVSGSLSVDSEGYMCIQTSKYNISPIETEAKAIIEATEGCTLPEARETTV